MFSGTDVHLPDAVSPQSSEAIRAVASGLDGVWGGGDLTARQHDFLRKHGKEVFDAVETSVRKLSESTMDLSDLTDIASMGEPKAAAVRQSVDPGPDIGV